MINAGDPVKAQIVNDAFMSRVADTSTIGKVSLLKPSSSGPAINDLQKFVNDIANTVGTFENNTSALDYATNYVVADGDSYKVAIEKIDVYAYTLRQDLNALDAREAANHAAQDATLNNHESRITTIESQDSTFGGDKTFSDDVTINGDLTVIGNTSLDDVTLSDLSAQSVTSLSLSVTNNASVGNNLSVSGNASVTNDLSVSGNTSLSGNLSVGLDVTITGDLTVDDLTADEGTFTSLTTTTLSANSVTAGSLDVSTNATVTGNLVVDGNLTVNGSQTILNTTTITSEDKLITLNKNGPASSGDGAGIEVEEGGNITGFVSVNNTRERWEIKAPGRAGVIELEPDTTNTSLVINRALFDSKADISSLGALAYKNTVGSSDIDDGAITTQKIDNLAVTTAKIDNGAVTTQKLDDGSVTEQKIASSALDQVSVIGGSGQQIEAVASVRLYAPQQFRTAGEAIPSGLVVCRYGLADLSENGGMVYVADNDFANGKYNATCLVVSSLGFAANDVIPKDALHTHGIIDLSSNVFSASDMGKRIYLGSNGSVTLNPPTSPGTVVLQIGFVITQSSLLFSPMLIGVN